MALTVPDFDRVHRGDLSRVIEKNIPQNCRRLSARDSSTREGGQDPHPHPECEKPQHFHDQSSLAAQEGTNPTYNKTRDAHPRKLPALGIDPLALCGPVPSLAGSLIYRFHQLSPLP